MFSPGRRLYTECAPSGCFSGFLVTYYHLLPPPLAAPGYEVPSDVHRNGGCEHLEGDRPGVIVPYTHWSFYMRIAPYFRACRPPLTKEPTVVGRYPCISLKPDSVAAGRAHLLLWPIARGNSL